MWLIYIIGVFEQSQPIGYSSWLSVHKWSSLGSLPARDSSLPISVAIWVPFAASCSNKHHKNGPHCYLKLQNMISVEWNNIKNGKNIKGSFTNSSKYHSLSSCIGYGIFFVNIFHGVWNFLRYNRGGLIFLLHLSTTLPLPSQPYVMLDP